MKKSLKAACLLSSLVLLTGCNVNDIFTGWFASKDVGSNELLEQYDLYETVKIPTHTFTSEKGSQTVKGVVILPDGNSYNNDTLTIKQVGQYEVRYSAVIDGKNYSETKTFLVKKPLFEYGNPNGSTISYSVPLFAKKYTQAEGVYVTLAKGDTLKINQAIDLTSTGWTDKVVSLFATPYVQGTFDFAAVNFVLRDSENPNIYLTLICNSQAQLPRFPEYCYFKAGGQNQTLTGKYTNPNTGAITYQKKGNLGTLAKISMHAAHNNGSEVPVGIDPSTEPIYFCYDAEDVAIHTPCKEYPKYAGATKCADFDNPEYFSTNLWTGFPSRKAYLEISGSRYQGNAARFCITDVLGVDMSQKYIEDNNAPEISVDMPADKMPEGKVGVTYKIPSATAFDKEEFLSKDVKTNVYYNYGTTSQMSVTSVGGVFSPTRNGTYVIEYTAKDLYGNVGVKAIPVHVGNQIEEIDFTLPTISTTVLAGKSIELGEAKNPSGGVGVYTTTVTATDALGKQQLELGTYTPRVVGDTVFTYTVTDYIGNSTNKNITVKVLENSSPVFLRYENLNAEYLTEFDNLMPSCVVNVVEDNKIMEKVCDITVADAKGSREYKFSDANEVFRVYGENTAKTATLTFSYKGVYVDEKTINLVESKVNGRLAMTNYFIGEGFAATNYSKGSVAGIKIKNNANVSSWRFFNQLTARNAKVNINKLYNASSFGFEKVNITLTDSIDPSVSVTLEVHSDYFLISQDSVKYAIDLVKDNFVNVAMDTTRVFVNNISFDIKYYDDGKAFSGFPSEKVYISATTYGSDSEYIVTIINNHLLYKTTDDTMPDYVVLGDYGGSYAVGSTYKLNQLVCADVVKPYSKATVTVKINDNNPVASDGTVLKDAPINKVFTFGLDMVGTYYVDYKFEGEENTFSYAVYSLDNQAPTIKITSQIPTTVSYGATISVPSFEVEDDMTAKEDITVIVSITNPTGYEQLMMYTLVDDVTGENKMVKVANSVVAIYRGTYRIKITAIDKTENTSFKMIEVLVK